MRFLVAVMTTLASTASAADVREGLYEISVRAELAGQPMTAAPMVLRQCVTQQNIQDLMSEMGGAGGCKVSDFQQSANYARWSLACTGQMEVSGTGETQINGDEFVGHIDLSVQIAGGQSLPMVQSFTAKRVGECQ